jgi:hypothetical protein
MWEDGRYSIIPDVSKTGVENSVSKEVDSEDMIYLGCEAV